MKPYRQGDLDNACGLYAIVNALRWCVRDQRDLLKEIDWEALFLFLVRYTHDDLGNVHLSADGMGTLATLRSMRASSNFISERHEGLDFRCHRPFARRRPADLAEMIDKISLHLERSGTSCVASTTGRLEHWTVLTAIRDEQVNLFDSLESLRQLPNKALSPKPKPNVSCLHVVPSTVILIEAIAWCRES